MPELKTCPGCGETYLPDKGPIIIQNAAGEMEPVDMPQFVAPDGTEYCCDACFELNGH